MPVRMRYRPGYCEANLDVGLLCITSLYEFCLSGPAGANAQKPTVSPQTEVPDGFFRL